MLSVLRWLRDGSLWWRQLYHTATSLCRSQQSKDDFTWRHQQTFLQQSRWLWQRRGLWDSSTEATETSERLWFLPFALVAVQFKHIQTGQTFSQSGHTTSLGVFHALNELLNFNFVKELLENITIMWHCIFTIPYHQFILECNRQALFPIWLTKSNLGWSPTVPCRVPCSTTLSQILVPLWTDHLAFRAYFKLAGQFCAQWACLTSHFLGVGQNAHYMANSFFLHLI